jgi:hypothetical protein
VPAASLEAVAANLIVRCLGTGPGVSAGRCANRAFVAGAAASEAIVADLIVLSRGAVYLWSRDGGRWFGTLVFRTAAFEAVGADLVVLFCGALCRARWGWFGAFVIRAAAFEAVAGADVEVFSRRTGPRIGDLVIWTAFSGTGINGAISPEPIRRANIVLSGGGIFCTVSGNERCGGSEGKQRGAGTER